MPVAPRQMAQLKDADHEGDRTMTDEILRLELGLDLNAIQLVGSQLICGEGNDRDYLCLAVNVDFPEQHGFERDSDHDYYNSCFVSWRRSTDNVNILVTDNVMYFIAEATAAFAAKHMNANDYDMTKREDRVAFHSAVRDEMRRFTVAGVTS